MAELPSAAAVHPSQVLCSQQIKYGGTWTRNLCDGVTKRTPGAAGFQSMPGTHGVFIGRHERWTIMWGGRTTGRFGSDNPSSGRLWCTGGWGKRELKREKAIPVWLSTLCNWWFCFWLDHWSDLKRTAPLMTRPERNRPFDDPTFKATPFWCSTRSCWWRYLRYGDYSTDSAYLYPSSTSLSLWLHSWKL